MYFNSLNSCIPGFLQSGLVSLYPRTHVFVDSEKRSASYRLPLRLIRAVEEEAITEGRERKSGRVFNPSAVVERILHAYFDAKPRSKPKPTK
jgi:hypothetical protein